MQRVGYVLHTSSSNRNLILKAEMAPRIGERVFDKSPKPIGLIADVFGPTSSPYVSVKTNMVSSQRLVKQILYVNSPVRQGGRRNK